MDLESWTGVAMEGQARVKKESNYEGPDDCVKKQWRVFDSL